MIRRSGHEVDMTGGKDDMGRGGHKLERAGGVEDKRWRGPEVETTEWDKRHTTDHYQRRQCFQLFQATQTERGQWSSEPDGEEFHCPL